MKRGKSFELALAEMPLFPLPQVVLFPRQPLPLHVFEPRYRAMLAHCLETHQTMAIVRLVHPQTDRIARVAGAGFIVEHQPLADGRSNILLVGEARVSLEELPFVPPFRRARATMLSDEETHVPDAERSALVNIAAAFAAEVRKRDPAFAFYSAPNLSPGALADAYAHQLVIDSVVRQRVLETLDVLERIRIVTSEIASQNAALSGRSGVLN